jgi:eukaryotic-like serine/threonine-protein kinase
LVRALQTILDRMRCIHPVSREILTLADGRTVVLVEPIGRGSCGSVYRGVIESGWGVERPVAVKIFETPPEVDHGEIMRRLGRIARRGAAVRHSAVVQVFELDRTDTSDGHVLPFLVTELVDGESLASLIDGWKGRGLRVPTDFAVVVTLRVAEALGAALFADCPDGSIAGLVHGDLSPRQVLVSSEGEVKVCDFGQASLRDLVSNVRSRTRLAYTAPEIACGAEPNARSDVYSLGVMLHELLLGPRFAQGTEFGEAVQMVRDGRFYLNVMEPNIPRGLRDIIERALDRTPMNRYSHARSLAFDLRREMFQLGLCDAATCVRQAVVGFCEVRAPFPSATEFGPDVLAAARQRSDVVPKLDDDDTAAETRKSKQQKS